MDYHNDTASASTGDNDDVRILMGLGFFGFTSFDQVNQFITGNTLDLDVLVIKDAPADSFTVSNPDFKGQFYLWWMAQGNKLYIPATYHAEMRKIGAIYDEGDARLLGKPTFTLDKAELEIMRNAASVLSPLPKGTGVQENSSIRQSIDPQLLAFDFNTPMEFDAAMDLDTPMQDNIDMLMQENFNFAPQRTQATVFQQSDDLDALLSLRTPSNAPGASDISQNYELPVPAFSTPIKDPRASDGTQPPSLVEPSSFAPTGFRNIFDGSEPIFYVLPTTTAPVNFPKDEDAYHHSFYLDVPSAPPKSPTPPSITVSSPETSAPSPPALVFSPVASPNDCGRSESPGESQTHTRANPGTNGTLNEKLLQDLLATGLYQAMYWQTKDQQGDINKCQPSKGYRRILTEMQTRGDIRQMPLIPPTLKANVVYSHAPPPSVDVRLLGDVYTTIVEILTFFPAHYMRWADVIYRLHGGRWSTRDPSKKIYSARGYIVVSGKRVHTTLVDRESNRISRFQKILGLKELVPVPYKDLTCQNWKHPKETPWGQKENAEDGHDLIDYYVSDLADGIPRALFPAGDDAGILTAVVGYVLDNPDDNECKQLMLSGVSAFAKSKGLFQTPQEAGLETNGVEAQHADTSARDRFIAASV